HPADGTKRAVCDESAPVASNRMRRARRVVPMPGDTMKLKMKMMLALVAAAVSFAAPIHAQVQEFTSEPYDFIVAKLAAEDQRYDEALTLIDKVIAKNPNDLVLRYERAMILVDAGRVEGAEKEL